MRLFLFLFAWTVVAQAEIRVAQEVELAPTALATIIDHFQIERLEGDAFRARISDDALKATPPMNMENWLLLPEDLGDWLAAGLNLPRRHDLEGTPPIETPEIVVGEFRGGKAQPVPSKVEAPPAPKALLGLDGQPLDLGLKPAGKPLDLPPPKPKALLTPLASDWPTLEARWDRHWQGLSMSQRVHSIPLRMLPREERARIAIALSPGSKKSNATWLPLRDSAPEGLRDALVGMVWGHDMGAMEFKHASHTADIPKYLRRLERFLSITHQPASGTGEGSYHLNVSHDGRNLDAFARQYNQLLLLRRLKNPNVNPFDQQRTVRFRPDHREKGLIHLDGSRLSVRAHDSDPRTELEELVDLLKLPEDKAIRQMAISTQQLLADHPEVVARVVDENPAYLYDIVDLTQKAIGREAKWKVSDPAFARAMVSLRPGLWNRQLEIAYETIEERAETEPEAKRALKNLDGTLLQEVTADSLARIRPDWMHLDFLAHVVTKEIKSDRRVQAKADLETYAWSQAEKEGFQSAWGRILLNLAAEEPTPFQLEEKLKALLIPPPKSWRESFTLWMEYDLANMPEKNRRLCNRLSRAVRQHYIERLSSADAQEVQQALSQLSPLLETKDPLGGRQAIVEASRMGKSPHRDRLLGFMAKRATAVPLFAREVLDQLTEINNPSLAEVIRTELGAPETYDRLRSSVLTRKMLAALDTIPRQSQNKPAPRAPGDCDAVQLLNGSGQPAATD